MQIFQVGEDKIDKKTFNKISPPNTLWIIYDFYAEDWDGCGTAVAFDGENFYECDLGYDSVYEGSDQGFWKSGTLKEYLSSDRSIFDEDWSDEIRNKINELI